VSKSRFAQVAIFFATALTFTAVPAPWKVAAAKDVFFPGQIIPHDEVLGDLPKGSGILPRRFAIVIGIDNYDNHYQDADDQSTSGFLQIDSLQHAALDAKNFADAIAAAGFSEARRLIAERPGQLAKGPDQRVTRNDILHAIGELANRISDSFRETGRYPIVLFYFAGHGLYYRDDSDQNSGSNFVAPSDFVPLSPKDIPEMGISVDEIITRLRDATPGLVIAIFDACRSDTKKDTDKKGTVQFGHQEGANFSPPPHTELQFEDTKRLWLLQSTLQHQPAADDGQFTRALVSAINVMRQNTAKHGSGLNSNFSALNTIIRDNLMSADGVKQGLTIREESPEFDFFATERDFRSELALIQLYISPRLNITGSDYSWQKRKDDEFNIWCQLSAERDKDTPFSYFGSFVKAVVDRYNSQFSRDQCGGKTHVHQYVGDSSGATDFTAGDSVVLTPQSAEAPTAGTTSTSVLLNSVSNVDYREAFGKLDLSQSINTLAISVTPSLVYESPAARGTPVCNLIVYGLIQLLGVSNEMVKVRTPQGCEGYTEKEAVSTGRSAISFSIPISPQTPVPDVRVEIPADFPSWMVMDCAIYFNTVGEQIPGIARAQANFLKARILEQVGRVSVQLAQTLNISVQRVSDDDLGLYNLAPGTVKAVLVVIPVMEETRRILPTRNFGTPISVSNAVDIEALSTNSASSVSLRSDSLTDFLKDKSLDAISRQANTITPFPGTTEGRADTHDLWPEKAPPAQVVNPDLLPAPIVPLPPGPSRPPEACLASADAQIEQEGDAAGRYRGFKAYVQITSSANQEVILAYNALTPALRRAGFVIPASEEVPPTKAPTGVAEVRYCPDGNNRDAAEFALNILSGCALPFQFKPPRSLGTATCRGKKVAGNIEIWLPR
jgi:Caspase domain